MAEKRIADFFRVSGRYLRSAHLERDFDDPSALDGYVGTPFMRECFDRIADGLRVNSGRRAWRVTGDYGSGKSSFALVVAKALGRGEHNLPPQIRRVFDSNKLGVKQPSFLPVLVTCGRQALGRSILQGLQKSLSSVYQPAAKARLLSEVDHLLKTTGDISDDDVIRAITTTNSQIIADSKAGGILLIVDELGKFLEFAALNPHRQDVFLLQRLAEVASRSSGAPFFVLGVLHQGFNAYADHLSQSAQREWEKVAGRFEEIIFDQPVEQIGELIASALNVATERLPRQIASQQLRAMEEAIRIGWLPKARDAALSELSPRIYPIHPTVLPALIRIFRRYGQNERSLFSFLLSNEPFGLQAFSERGVSTAEPYRLHNLYDYVRTAFGHRLSAHTFRSHWNLIDSVIEAYGSEDLDQIHVLKTVGILNLLNDDLVASEESLIAALGSDDRTSHARVSKAIDKVHRVKRVLYYRGRARGLSLWPHTSVDLEEAYANARRSLQAPETVGPFIRENLETRPIVARRHYITTGNLRHFNVRYCSVSEMGSIRLQPAENADGQIVIPLCESVAEHEAAVALAQCNHFCALSNLLIAVPQPLANLSPLALEVQRWEAVIKNTPELNSDKFGREEAARQLQNARTQLARGIQSNVGLKQFGGRTSLKWFHRGKEIQVADGLQLLSLISRLCDETYPGALRIHNELVNRRTLSSAAAAARMRLIEHMFSHASTEFLGMDPRKKPPEMSMYLSVLHRTGIHRKCSDGWVIDVPSKSADENCNVLPTFAHIRRVLESKPDARIKITELFNELRKPPLGIRDGMLPLLLTVFAIANEQEIAFYKDGTFLRQMTAEAMLVLTKMPERFEIQSCKIEGVRSELFQKLSIILEVAPNSNRRTELLDVVKRLCVFVAQLPVYVHNTRKLSTTATAVRDAILSARDPAQLLFTELPRACGFSPFLPTEAITKEVHAFIRALKAALDELRLAFPDLQERLRKSLRETFPMPGEFPAFRKLLARRAENLVVGVNEPKLRAFCIRLFDELPESDWLESLGSFLALKPPGKWHDSEENSFYNELADLAARFQRVESINFTTADQRKKRHGIRVAITQANGLEHEQVIHIGPEEEEKLSNLQKRFEALLVEDNRLGLAAASRAIWRRLEPKKSKA